MTPNSLCLGQDGLGNYWILDIADNGELGKVFYVSHDPAVFVIHSESLNEYLNHLLEFYKSPGECHLNTIHSKAVSDVWKHDKSTMSKVDFIHSNPEFVDFADQFEGEAWTIADLRAGRNEDGFAWGKQGPEQHIERHPTELVWIIEKKKKSLLSRLLGR